MFSSIKARPTEAAAFRPGDDLIPDPDIVMNRAFTVDGAPQQVWPWLQQLGKKRAGWYLLRTIERILPKSRRAARTINPEWQKLRIGDIIPDYGGRAATFEVASIDPPVSLVYRSRRGRTNVTWSITLQKLGPIDQTRVHLRLRLAPVRHKRLAATAGEFLDALSIVGMAAGLRERLGAQPNPPETAHH